MNAVSDGFVIINIMGIRTVNWGEAQHTSSAHAGKPYFLTVQYKGNRETFYYRTQVEAYTIFTKVREAMDKSFKQS